jgi:hypothetical protein
MPAMFPRPALLVAHPGHELRLHRWLEVAQPVVFVLTDGSGASNESRIPSTRALLERTGARAGTVFGALTDREAYRAILDGDVRRFTAITLDIARAIADSRSEVVVADVWEGYNPVHDVCRAIADLAVEQAATLEARSIRSYTYAVTTPAVPSGAPDELVVPLDDAALERMLDAAAAYAELRQEADRLISTFGRESLRREVLSPWQPRLVPPPMQNKPHYERYGEERVAAGRYGVVLRYDEHVAPFLHALGASVRAAVNA